jgi:hypothetical protein
MRRKALHCLVIYNINGQQLRGVRVTGYDANKRIFTHVMIQDGGNGVAMKAPGTRPPSPPPYATNS